MVKKTLAITAPRKEAPDVEEQAVKKTRWRNLVAFWILGLCNNYGYVVMLSAAHDILNSKFGNSDSTDTTDDTSNSTSSTRTCNNLSTGAILLADILPALAVKAIAPFLPFVVHIRMASCVILGCAGYLLVSLSSSEWLAILGVVCTSFASGLGEVTMLSYSYQYSKNVISTWSSGTGGAGVIGAVSYAGLSMWLSTEQTLLVMLVVPVIQAVTFWFILVHPKQTIVPIVKQGTESQQKIVDVPTSNFKDKLHLIPGLMKYMIPIGLVYLFEYFINQGLFELIEFSDIWLSHTQQYRWLQVDYQIGVFISRSSVNLITIDKIWLMAVLQFANVIILTFETLYYYIPNIWIIFAIVLWEGLLGGGAYVNTFYKMSKEVPQEEREFSLGITTMADSIGIALAGWLAMPVHNAICKLPQPTRLG